MRRPIALLIALALAGLFAGEAAAEVRFGKNVFIGGHDFSNRRYESVTIKSVNKRPPWYGCRVLAAGTVYQGRTLRQRTEICNLKRIRRRGR